MNPFGNFYGGGQGNNTRPRPTRKVRRNPQLGSGKPTPLGGNKGWFGDLVRHWIRGRTCNCMHSGTGEGFTANLGSHGDCNGACAGGQGVWVGAGSGGNQSSGLWGG